MTATEIPGVRWVLDCEPRPVQLEAIARSYTGKAYRMTKEDPFTPQPIFALSHAGKPAKGFPFFMEMRLGKTPTFLNEFILFHQDYGITKALIFSPSKYKTSWGAEAERFGIGLFDMPVHVFQSSKKGRKEAKQFVAGNRGILVVNYEAMLYEENRQIFEEWVDNYCVVGADESVLIKNRNSLFFEHCHELNKSGTASRIMTGKPVVQGPQDLYSQLRFARQYDGVNFYQFRNVYCEMGGFKGKKIIGVKNEDRLQHRLTMTAFTAYRRDWGTWFEPDQQEIIVPLQQRQEELYRDMEKDFVIWLDEHGGSVTAEQAITRHMKLQQISSGFIYDGCRNVHWLIDFAESPKIKEFLDRMENEISSKVIVIAVHKPVIGELINVFEKAGLNPAWIMGGSDDTEEQKHRFNNDPTCRVMVGQEKAIKYGHTLMGNQVDPCDVMFYFENTYSLDDRAQTIERPQGEGQQGPLTVFDFASTPIERKIIKALQDKDEISKVIMNYYKRATSSDW